MSFFSPPPPWTLSEYESFATVIIQIYRFPNKPNLVISEHIFRWKKNNLCKGSRKKSYFLCGLATKRGGGISKDRATKKKELLFCLRLPLGTEWPKDWVKDKQVHREAWVVKIQTFAINIQHNFCFNTDLDQTFRLLGIQIQIRILCCITFHFYRLK